MKIFCSSFDNYEKFTNTKRKEDHLLNLKTRLCSCKATLRYFCEICKENVSHSTFQRKHKHKNTEKQIDTETPKFESLIEEPPNKKRNMTIHFSSDNISRNFGGYCAICKKGTFIESSVTISKDKEIWICMSCFENYDEKNIHKTFKYHNKEELSINNSIIASQIHEIRKIYSKFNFKNSFTVEKLLQKLRGYSWMSFQYYNNSFQIRKEILSICVDIWFREEGFLDNANYEVMDLYTNLLTDCAYGEDNNFDFLGDILIILYSLAESFQDNKSIKNSKVQMEKLREESFLSQIDL